MTTRGRVALAGASLSITLAILAACVGSDPDVTSDRGDSGTAATPPDGSTQDDGGGRDALPPDAGEPRDGGTDALPDVVYTYADYRDASVWQTFDLDAAAPAASLSYAGAGYDGRYVYLAPNNVNYGGSPSYEGTKAARYDTQGSFTSAAGWSFFDTTTKGSSVRGFNGVAFDGNAIYFVPRYNGSYHGMVLRYDRLGSFDNASSWQTFDTAGGPGGAGFTGAVFDGKYLYFVPGVSQSTVARYDTTAPFTANGSWTGFSLVSAVTTTAGWDGGTFDGRYVYLFNYGTENAVRYDTQAPFSSASSWQAFATTQIDARAKGFRGGGFDGRYVYYVPHYGTQFDGFVVRYDTTGSFTSTQSWQSIDLLTLNGNLRAFAGAVFDGRNVYLIPQYTNSGLFARYDTTSPFGNTASWLQFDTSGINAKATVYLGGVFDGQYLYAVPQKNGIIVRADVKTPPGLPPKNNASFY